MSGAYHSDPAIAAAWENRHSNERAFRNKFESLIGQIRDELTPKIDPEATADREAIASFMRGGRDKPAAPPLPRDLNSMSDKDFKKLTRDRFGYDTRLD